VGAGRLDCEHFAASGVEDGYALAGRFEVAALARGDVAERSENDFQIASRHWITGRTEAK
jgi:hypothetical protein